MSEQQPAKRFIRGRCSVSIFYNEVQKDGETIKIPKAVLQKRYRDKDRNWQTASGFDTSDIPKAILCLSDAFDFLTRSPNSASESE